jgi:hypothetical protein
MNDSSLRTGTSDKEAKQLLVKSEFQICYFVFFKSCQIYKTCVSCLVKMANASSEIFNGEIGGVAKASVIHPKDPCSNLGPERFFLILFVSHLNPNL